MLNISVWNPKGGAGKTTVALTLAGYFAASGKKTVLIDKDPQQSAMLCAHMANQTGYPLPFSVVPNLIGPADVAIYDHAPGMDAGLPTASLVVMPTLLSAQDWAATLAGLKALQAANRLALVVPNRVLNRADQIRLLSRHFKESPYLTERAAFSNSFGRGMTIFSEGAPAAGVARAEALKVINAFAEAVKVGAGIFPAGIIN